MADQSGLSRLVLFERDDRGLDRGEVVLGGEHGDLDG